MELDSLDWSRKYDVLSISRLSLHSSGIPYALVAGLTDEDMQAIADKVHEAVLKDGVIEIQGDHCEKVQANLTELGYRVKRAGG